MFFRHFHFFFWWSIRFAEQNINKSEQELVVQNCQWNCMFEKETMFFKHVFLQGLLRWLSLREKCPIRSFFWSVFSRIRTEYGKIRARKNSIFGHFSRSVCTQQSHIAQQIVSRFQLHFVSQLNSKESFYPESRF